MNTQNATPLTSLKNVYIKNTNSTLDYPPKICMPTLDGFVFIKISQISYCKSEDIYSRLFTTDGDQYFIMKPLKWIEAKCERYNFYRVHKSFLINIYNIHKHVKKDGGYLQMDNKGIVPISRTKKKELNELLGL